MTSLLTRNILRPAACLVAMLLFSQAESKASFTLTPGALTQTNPTSGGTTVTLTSTNPQPVFNFSSNANLIDVGIASTNNTPPGDVFSTNFSQTFTLSGTTAQGAGGGPEVLTLTGTLNVTQGLNGGIISNVSNTNVAVVSGSGFNVSFASYAQPSPNTTTGNPSVGNISILIQPVGTAAVPEPASIAMLGLGLSGVGLVAARRRRSAK